MRMTRKLLVSLAAVLLCCTTGFAQTVSNVVASQEGNSIVVSYEIDKSSPEVGLTVSTDGGKTFSAPLTKVTGDVKNVQPGRRSIVWDVLAEMESFKGDNIVFNVIAKSENNHNGHEWVDLGLSVKWATCNVGASSPEGYGDYFAWGETSPKSSYNWKNLKYRTSGDSYDNVKFSKYVTDGKYGPVDNRTTLELSDDAVRANWGGNWRMPTIDEFQELIDKCIWAWTKMNGKKGYKVTSKRNGNSIFLPAAGWRDGTSLCRGGSYGYYLSGSLDESISCSVRNIGFNSGNHNLISVGMDTMKVSMLGLIVVGNLYMYDNRYYGHSVRPVCP